MEFTYLNLGQLLKYLEFMKNQSWVIGMDDIRVLSSDKLNTNTQCTV